MELELAEMRRKGTSSQQDGSQPSSNGAGPLSVETAESQPVPGEEMRAR
jgi:hypothetical protein